MVEDGDRHCTDRAPHNRGIPADHRPSRRQVRPKSGRRHLGSAHGGNFFALSIIDGFLVAFYAGFIAFNVLGSATGPISYTRPVAQSFVASRGTAVAIALSGIAIPGVLLPPLLGPMLAHGGWRAGYRLIAAGAADSGLQ